jgi:hypothetical protein
MQRQASEQPEQVPSTFSWGFLLLKFLSPIRLYPFILIIVSYFVKPKKVFGAVFVNFQQKRSGFFVSGGILGRLEAKFGRIYDENRGFL